MSVFVNAAPPGKFRGLTLLSVLAQLVEPHAGIRSSPPPSRERQTVRLAREYLEDNLGKTYGWKISHAWRT